MTRRPWIAVTVGAAATVVAAAGPAPAKIAAGAPNHQVKLSLNEFKINPFATQARAGAVRVSAVNHGRKTHELIVVRWTRQAGLPVHNGRVDEAALRRAGALVGEISGIKAGRTGAKTFRLDKGTYAVFCNLPGHYGAGMRATLVVRSR
jgi:uncharacterized cupredoxin-like copper-binding protein